LETFFFDGVFRQGTTAIGDAVNFAKASYLATPNYPSLLYSFMLLGDPAMQVLRPEIALDLVASQQSTVPGGEPSYNLLLQNNGILPDYTTINLSFSEGLSFVSASSVMSLSVVTDGSTTTLTLDEALARGESTTIQITAQVEEAFAGNNVTLSATATPLGMDLDPLNQSAASITKVIQPNDTWYLYLPGMQRP
jgi:hypothetical protein